MSSVSKISNLAKCIFNEKDCLLIDSLLKKHKFDEIGELVTSELTKEYRKCAPEKMTDRYCQLQEMNFILIKFDAFVVDENYSYNVDY